MLVLVASIRIRWFQVKISQRPSVAVKGQPDISSLVSWCSNHGYLQKSSSVTAADRPSIRLDPEEAADQINTVNG
ncbi:hypothetical protein ILYODFUR_034668 [Ilyodon furcidens]|uniref:Uncharacterized protein n=1 Tax=Ilyodon furcidens TaxID=33524 RepID=A0ABV0ULJ2_9TELE